MLRAIGGNLVWVDPVVKAMSDPTVPAVLTACLHSSEQSAKRLERLPEVSFVERVPMSVSRGPMPGMSAASTASDETSIYFASTGSGGVGKLTPPARSTTART